MDIAPPEDIINPAGTMIFAFVTLTLSIVTVPVASPARPAILSSRRVLVGISMNALSKITFLILAPSSKEEKIEYFKIGRFAVSSSFKGQNLGSGLIAMLKDLLNGNPNYSAFRYLTVDAYMSAIGFYEKNGFKILSEKSIGDHTRLMFFDMMELE